MADDQFPIDNLNPEDLLHIDMESLDTDSVSEAKDMVRIVTDLFYDEKFKEDHPQAHRRIEMEIETLRGLIKMRKADEEVHDAILQAISENKNNASLYRAMAEIQKTSIALSNKIHDTIDRLNKICADFTSTEISLPEDELPEEGHTTIHRGTKSFIEEMNRDRQ